MKMKKGARLLLFLLMLLFCVIIIIPFLIMFFTSLKTQAEISGAAFRLLPEPLAVFQLCGCHEII